MKYNNLIIALHSGHTISVHLHTPRIGMITADPSKERGLMCMNIHHHYMDCTHCKLPCTVITRPQILTPNTIHFSDNEHIPSPNRLNAI